MTEVGKVQGTEVEAVGRVLRIHAARFIKGVCVGVDIDIGCLLVIAAIGLIKRYAAPGVTQCFYTSKGDAGAVGQLNASTRCFFVLVGE